MKRATRGTGASVAVLGAFFLLGSGGPSETAGSRQPGEGQKSEAAKPDAARAPAGAAAPAADEPPAKDAPDAAISWGESRNGLQLGLSISKARFAPGEPIPLTIRARNTGGKPLVLSGIGRWHVSLAPSVWSAALAPAGGSRRWPTIPALALAPGEEESVPMTIGADWRFYDESLNAPDLHPRRELSSGRYTLRVSCDAAGPAESAGTSWEGAAGTGTVALEVADPPGPERGITGAITAIRAVPASTSIVAKPAVEIEVEIADSFPVRDEVPVLRIGDREFTLSRFTVLPDRRNGLAFTLGREAFEALPDGAEVSVRYGRGGPRGPGWAMGRLDKKQLWEADGGPDPTRTEGKPAGKGATPP